MTDKTLKSVLNYLRKTQPPYTGPSPIIVYHLETGRKGYAWDYGRNISMGTEFLARTACQPAARVDRIVEHIQAEADVETATQWTLLEETL